MTKWIAAKRAKTEIRHTVACPNVTGRTKEREAQSKRARAGLLAIYITFNGVAAAILHVSDVFSLN